VTETGAVDLPVLEEGPEIAAGEVLLRAEHIKKYFPIRSGVLVQREVARVHAVDDVSFELRAGETLGLVGESGCGKSTLARCIARLYDLTSGSLMFEGNDISGHSRRQLRTVRRDLQMVFQDPYASLNPRKRVGAIISDPLRIHRAGNREQIRRRVLDLLELVGLSSEHINRYPHEFSGGQRQRIGVARALALKPKLVIADEPVSALDVSIRAQVINLLDDLQDELSLTYIFIAHDLGVVRHVSDRIAVMYLGKIVELSPAEELYERPVHPYTEALLSAVPIPDPDLSEQRQRIVLEGDVPSPISPPTGCRFHPRCRYATEICRTEEPPLTQHGSLGHLAACHHPLNFGPQPGLTTSAAESAAARAAKVLPTVPISPISPIPSIPPETLGTPGG
jgi:peptide/nickel transport system ATP-binding protein